MRNRDGPFNTFCVVTGLSLYPVDHVVNEEQQRVTIGTLKAFGFTDREVVWHYLTYPLLIGTIGGLLGGLSGIALSFPLTAMYKQYFALPGLKSEFSVKYLLIGIHTLKKAGFYHEM